jgi:hypothetical protein
MKKDLTKFLIAVCLMFTASLFSQSTTSSYTQTLRFFNSDNLQIYQGARIAAPTMTLPNSLTTYTSSLAFGNSDLRQIYNAVRGMGDAVSGSTNTSWNITGNTVGTNTAYIGTNDNRSFRIVTNGTFAATFDSLTGKLGLGVRQPTYEIDVQFNKPSSGLTGIRAVNTSSTGFAYVAAKSFTTNAGIFVVGPNASVGGAYSNNNAFFQCSTAGEYGLVNENATGTFGLYVGGFGAVQQHMTVQTNGRSNFRSAMLIGNISTVPAATLHILGTFSVQSTTTLTGVRNNGTFTTTGASMIGGTTAGSATLHVLGTASVSGSSTLTGVRNNGTVSCTGNFSTTARVQFGQGVSVASTAGAMTVGGDGNVFEITGTNAITAIANTSWQNGSEITLYFTSTASLTDGVANSGANIGFELAGNVNFTATADDALTLVLCTVGGTQRWREKCRSVN